MRSFGRKIINNKKYNLVLNKRKEELEVAGKLFSLTETALVILGDIAGVAIKSFFPHPYYHAFCSHREKSFRTTVSRLEKKGLIQKVEDSEKFFILTPSGKKERDASLKKLSLNNKLKNEKWDGKWRIALFDIPEKQKSYRNFLRAELMAHGFIQFQKSAWISPFRASEELKNIIEEMGIDRWVKLVIVDLLSGESEILNKFHIKRR